MTDNQRVIGGGRRRNSGIELLRIIAACAVIALHYNGMGHVFEVSSGISKEIMTVLESFCVCAVDVFIMISGYFLCKNNKRTWDKPLYLFLTLSAIVSISYICVCLIEHTSISPVTVVHSMIPPKNYFVLLYITLYIISPYINTIIFSLSDRSLKAFMIVMLCLFSLYPTLMDSYQHLLHGDIMGVSTVGAWGQQHGYNIVNFSLCYLLGASVRRFDTNKRLSYTKLVGAILISVTCIFLWYHAGSYISHGSQKLVDSNALSYSNPFVLLLSVSMLTLFTKINFENSFINHIAKASFVCYLLNLVILPRIGIEEYAVKGGLVLMAHLIVTIIAIYIASYIVWLILDTIISPITRKVARYNISEIIE